MAATPAPTPYAFWQSISFKNLLLFLLILLVALSPLALRYDQDSREYEINILASKLEFFAERGASWIDVGLRQRDFIRDAFGRYISKDVANEILDSPDGLKLGGETREVTFLVSDLRGFTSLSSRLPPQDVIDILNRYLERMVDIIDAHRGTVDEFQGDGILAFFGAPIAAEDDQERAVACAIAMQTALIDINAEQRRRQLPELNMGIGINTGNAILGNIGSEKRTKYGAVGSAINEAYRIESYTVGGQIFISPSVYERVRELVDLESTQEVQFKGLDEPITLLAFAAPTPPPYPPKPRRPLSPSPPPYRLSAMRSKAKRCQTRRFQAAFWPSQMSPPKLRSMGP